MNAAEPAVSMLLAARLEPGDHEPLREALRQLGYSPTVRVMPPARTGTVTWLVLLSLPLTAFLTTLGSKLAEDAYRGFRAAVAGLLRRRRDDPAAGAGLVLQDQRTGRRVILEADLPEPAYRELVTIDLDALGDGTIRYDRTAGRWAASPAG